MPSFFVSYNKADKDWAEWIAWTLEEADHTAVIQAWDFRPGGNFVLDMQRAAAETDKTLVVLSNDYLNAEFTQSEWAAAFAEDPRSLERKIIPIRVRECNPAGLLRPIVYVDLVGLEVDAARQAILNALPDRIKPTIPPSFPRIEDISKSQITPIFPNVYESNLIQHSFPETVNWLARKTDFLERLAPCYDDVIERILENRINKNFTTLEFDVLELTFTYCRLYLARKSLIYSPKFKGFSDKDFLEAMRQLSHSKEKLRFDQAKLSTLIKTRRMAELVARME